MISTLLHFPWWWTVLCDYILTWPWCSLVQQGAQGGCNAHIGIQQGLYTGAEAHRSGGGVHPGLPWCLHTCSPGLAVMLAHLFSWNIFARITVLCGIICVLATECPEMICGCHGQHTTELPYSNSRDIRIALGTCGNIMYLNPWSYAGPKFKCLVFPKAVLSKSP